MRHLGTVRLAILATGLGGLTGCEEEGPGLSFDDAPLEIARAVCPKAYGCCSAGQLMGNDLAGTDEPTCESKTHEGFRRHLEAVRASQKKGRVVYRGDNVASCVAFIKGASCQTLNTTSHFTGVGHGCDAFIEPKQNAGAACSFDWECVDGACERPMAGGEGTCRPLAKQGDSCAQVTCAKGLACDGSTRTCGALFAEGAGCSERAQCASGNCAPRPSGGPACAPAPADKCFYASACSYGHGRVPTLGIALAAAVAIAALRRRRARVTRA